MSDQLARWRTLVSPRVGIVRHLFRVPRGPEEPPLPVVYQATLAHFGAAERDPDPDDHVGAGKGETDELAMLGALGEAVEYYCAAHPLPGAVRRAARAELGDRALDPSDFVLYAEEQYRRSGFPFRRFDDGAEIGWVPVEPLTVDRGVNTAPVDADRRSELPLAPAALVYLGYEDAACRFVSGTSSGLAAGQDRARATLSALYEVVERDAFMVVWHNRLPAPAVDPDTFAGLPRAVRRHYARFGVELRVFDITTDIAIPAMLAVALDRTGDGPAAVFGLGCDLDPARAMHRAVAEVCQCRPGETMRYRAGDGRGELRTAEVLTPLDHSARFAGPSALPELGFLLDHDRRRDARDLVDDSTGHPEADTRRCLDRLASAGSRVYRADLTSPDVAPLGVSVVRVLATELQPIHFGDGLDRLGGGRVYDVARRLGCAASRRAAGDLNLAPHPLA